ncbi:MAG TPA: aminotransferase class V-fold PLP-dependent enzyme [Candidatus Krumholzibacteria bacterium]|nr:aminotransferase class V-fold PLP-dependent enzyme [Candidatus Krumholzibacteria bacterium]
MPSRKLDFAYLRSQIVGVDSSFSTPFGQRMLVYCDYTASGRTLRFVEEYLQGLQRHYANTHTEDDVTGRSMTRLLHEAECTIKDCVNAGPQGRIVAVGTGATGAIDKLQQMVGVMVPPATRHLLFDVMKGHLGTDGFADFEAELRTKRPVVFVGPYEHHSNEVTWREGLAEVVEVDLDDDGGVDLHHLEQLLLDPQWHGRLRFGSFSAGSNVTGMRTPVREIARLLHAHDAFVCFDYAATGPYVEIDMNPTDDPQASIDAIFVSPHKFLGGPGSSGILVFHERLYRKDLPPTVGGGGTVDYVGEHDHDFTADVEGREKAGTPGVLQSLKAALAFDVKRAVGTERIEAREHELVTRALDRWQRNPRFELLGNPDPRRRVAILSFNLKTPTGSYLHPKYVTTLANDLFGIQSRAGCSCAGPYGHRLLGIDEPTSERYRACIRDGVNGIKPGWCRVGFHYVMDDAEADYVVEAIDLMATEGHRFLPLYRFDPVSGGWEHRESVGSDVPFGLQAALCACHVGPSALSETERRRRYAEALDFARSTAAKLSAVELREHRLDGEAGALQFFALPATDEPGVGTPV